MRAYLRIVNRRKLTILLVTVLFGGLALAYSLVKTPVYTATATVLVPEQSGASALQPTGSQQAPQPASLQRTLTDAQQFAQGDQTQAAARAILHRKVKVSVTASTTADLLTFTTSNTLSTRAAAIANGYARAYIAANLAAEVGQYTSQVQAIQGSISALQGQVASMKAGGADPTAAQASITSLVEDLQQLRAASQLAASSSPTVINAANPPTAPSSPKTSRDVALAVVLGLLLGLALALVRERLDDKLRSTADVEFASGGHPVIGSIPQVDNWRKGSATHVALREDADSAVSEAYRTLRTSIQFLGIEDPQRVIGITSSTPDEGKSTATANLAVSFARAGQRVVAMSFDFRRPRLHLFFGLDNDSGATSVLLGQSALSESLRDVRDEPNLRVLPSGPVPPNPAEILSLDRVRQMVDLVAKNADVVLIDCPPTLPVTDTLLISRLCDAMLVLTVAGVTKRENLRRTHLLLSQVQAPVRGTIVNRTPNSGAYAGGYGYGYGYSAQPTEGATASGYRSGPLRRPNRAKAAGTNGHAPGGSSAPEWDDDAFDELPPSSGQPGYAGSKMTDD